MTVQQNDGADVHLDSTEPQDNVSDLLRRIQELEKQNKYLHQQIKKRRYGLTWIDVPEAFDPESGNKIPVLEEVKEKSFTDGSNKPTHILIEGNNYHALTCLQYTHKGKIDVIYIDPPYNTGSDGFTYKDKRILTQYPDGTPVPKDHPLRHSYWLSFMQKRLELAKNLLSDDGVIFISIDDNEQANLKLLCDRVLDSCNFINCFQWEKTQHFGRQKINYYSNCEYVLCYAKKLTRDALKELLVEKINTELTDAPLFNASNPEKDLTFPVGSVRFNIADQKYHQTSSEQYYLIEPVVVENNTNANELKLRFRSRWAQKTVDEEYRKGTTFWVKSDKFAIRTIYHNGRQSNVSPKSLIFTNSNNPLVAESRFGTKVGVNENATMELNNIIQTDLFSYPKPVSLIEYLLSLYYNYHINQHNPNITILDFFAGSGTTLHATLKLNAEDGGKRQCIMVQQNEGDKHICEEVTYERNRRVMQGYTNANGEEIAGMGGSLKYYKTAFTGADNSDRDPIMRPSDEDRIYLAQNAGVLVSLAENTLYETTKNDFFQIFTDNHGKFAAVYLQEDLSHFETFKQEVEKLDGQVAVYIFSWGSTPDAESSFRHLPNVSVKAYPNAILASYKQAYQQLENNK